MAASATVRVVREVPDDFWHGPLRRAFEDWLMMAHAAASQPGRVPIDTGNLRSSLQPGGVTGVDPDNPPKWARVGTNVEYARVLDESDRTHYADGPSMGNPTRGWLTDLDKVIEADTAAIIGDLASAIASEWKG